MGRKLVDWVKFSHNWFYSIKIYVWKVTYLQYVIMIYNFNINIKIAL